MDRREFLVSVAGGLLAAPLAAEAQQAGRMYRIGYLAEGPPPSSVLAERQARLAAIAELERLLSIDREAFVRRVRESGELEQLRARFERLRTMADTHAAEMDQWSRRIGHPLQVPGVAFPWPPAAIWDTCWPKL